MLLLVEIVIDSFPLGSQVLFSIMSLLPTYDKNKIVFEVLLKSFDGPNTMTQSSAHVLQTNSK